MGRTLKCAVIDDDQDWIDMVRRCLAKLTDPVEVLKFTDAVDALSYLQVNTVDLILTDVRMPGMDGFTFVAELRLLDIATPVVVLSSDESAAEKARDAGANAFVRKGALNTQLVPSVERVIAEREAWPLTKAVGEV